MLLKISSAGIPPAPLRMVRDCVSPVNVNSHSLDQGDVGSWLAGLVALMRVTAA